jgi:glycerol-3-phosphate acyltransferase PlsY
LSSLEIALVVGSYVLGGFCAAYYLVRLSGRGDVRSVGSGNAGATNAARLLGRTGFLCVFGLDLVKGVIPVGVARLADMGTLTAGLAMIAVVLGHVLPLQLGFQGGKGVSTAMGALLVFDTVATGIVLAAFVPGYLVFRRFTPAGLAALGVTPVALLGLYGPTLGVGLVATLVALVLMAHHEDLRETFARRGAGAVAPVAEKE